MIEWQTSWQPSGLPSTVAHHDDMNQFSAAWNSSSAAHNLSSSSHFCGRDVASELADVKQDGAYAYSTDPDHETDDEDCAEKQCVVSEKVIQLLMTTVLQKYLLQLKNIRHIFENSTIVYVH